MRRRFVVLVSGTLVYGRGDEAEARKAAAVAEADGLAGYGEEAGTPPRFAPVRAAPAARPRCLRGTAACRARRSRCATRRHRSRRARWPGLAAS